MVTTVMSQYLLSIFIDSKPSTV